MKAMLVMDMPKCCALCELYYSQVGLPKCTVTWRTIDFKNTEARQEWCPLREVPQKIGIDEALKMPRDGCIGDVIRSYNACIDEILGGGE